jgi:histidinol dehydrogenase
MSELQLLESDAPDFEAKFAALEQRRLDSREQVDRVVAEIVARVRERGDRALVEYAEQFDGLVISEDELVLDRAAIEKGAAVLPADDRAALELAAARIRDFHERSVPSSWLDSRAGERLGQLVRPLERVGIYVPASQVPLASTTLMLAVPASVAGVREIVMAVSGRELHPAILAAADLAGVTQLLRSGGAQAVAALAYGTERVPGVDKIVGPGQRYAQAAKRQVFGDVAIDAEAGPSEVLIIAEADAPARYVAADLLAQAEHVMASVVLATPSRELAAAVLEELDRQLPRLPHQDEMRASLRERSAAIVTRDLEEAFALSDRYAPEHLELFVADPDPWLERVRNAGAIFLGSYSPVPLGDYVAGPSHVLPTGGTARFFSGVGVEDFTKRMSVVEISREGIAEIGPAAIRLAELEGLVAHAEAVRVRLADQEDE